MGTSPAPIRKPAVQKMSPWQKLLERPRSREHFVQLYGTGEPSLARNVGTYLAEGLNRGDGVLLIATPAHRSAFLAHLDEQGVNHEQALRSGQLVALDARQTLSQFMTGALPDWDLFEATARTALRGLQKTNEEAGFRAYGEMVGLLWNERQYAAAIQLEHYWNKFLEQFAFSLYCAYSIDVFGEGFHPAHLDGILCSHTHLFPSQPDGGMEAALNAALDDVLGDEAAALRERIRGDAGQGWAVMPKAESMVLWLKKHLPQQAPRIVARAREYSLTTQ